MSKFKIIILSVLAFAFSLNVVSAQEKKHGELKNWKELKAFHEVIAQTFHPSEENNLEPIRKRSGELHNAAVALNSSKVPAEFDTKEVHSAMKNLIDQTKELDDNVKNKVEDADIKKLISIVHDTFHQIVGLCEKGEHHEESEKK